jgi:hypothetical protein
VQLEGEQFWKILSVILFVIDMMNNVHSLPTDLLTDLPTELPMEFIPSVKITRHHFFCFVLIFFSHGNSLGIYRGNIYVGKIPQKFTDEKIPSVLQFVFIDFLVVISQKYQILNSSNKLIICFNQNKSYSKI